MDKCPSRPARGRCGACWERRCHYGSCEKSTAASGYPSRGGEVTGRVLGGAPVTETERAGVAVHIKQRSGRGVAGRGGAWLGVAGRGGAWRSGAQRGGSGWRHTAGRHALPLTNENLRRHSRHADACSSMAPYRAQQPYSSPGPTARSPRPAGSAAGGHIQHLTAWNLSQCVNVN